MPKIEVSKKFERERKKIIKKNVQIAKRIVKSLVLFSENISHPSLNLEKLIGTYFWTIRVDDRYRIFLIWKDKNTVILIDVGEHDKYRRY